MWIVVCKNEYYPSVYEFDSEEEAYDKFNELTEDFEPVAEGDENSVFDNRIYIAEVESYIGTLEDDVEW